MNQAPTSLEVVGAPPPNWVEEFPNPSDSQSIHTPQGPAEDAPKNWNYQKIKWYLKKFFFLFYKWLPETCWSFQGGEGELAEFMECAPSAPWNRGRAGPCLRKDTGL